MGTNYYGIKIPTEKDKIKIKKAIDKNEWGTVRELIPERIHIGKSSAGWEFCFDHNYWQYFEKDHVEIKEFINSLSIFDEYGESIPHRTFWEKVVSKIGGLVSDDDRLYITPYLESL